MKLWKFWSPRDSGAVDGIAFGLLLSGTLRLLGFAPNTIMITVILAALIVYAIDRLRA